MDIILILFVVGILVMSSANVQVDTVKRLTIDLLGDKYGSYFEYNIISKYEELDIFELSTKRIDGNIIVCINGTNGVSLASGLNWYLKYYLNSEITWGYGDTWKQITIPSILPEVVNIIKQKTRFKHRYYLNVCTVSYTMAFWDIERWLREIDWAALQGYNEILSFTGQEYIFKKTFEEFGLNEDDIFGFFAGPAFLAWGRMANIKSYPGKLDNTFVNEQKDMQIKIVERIRNYGMKNILPTFAGFIPDRLKTLYPSMKTLKSSNWCYFNDTYSGVSMIDPSDEMLTKIGKRFLEIQNATFGTDNLYNCDIFNEMTPPSSDLSYLTKVGKSIINYMLEFNKNSIWVMQAWLFLNDGFWNYERVQAFLKDVPNDKMIILDLSTDDRPQWSRFDSYFDKSWIYNVLHNFGGRRAIYGNLDRIVKSLNDAIKTPKSTITGLGLTMEAIDQNPIVYEFTSELIWNDNINTTKWIHDYAMRRAGISSDSNAGILLKDAWNHLYKSSYSSNCWYYDVTFNTLSMRPGPLANQDFSWTNVTDTVYVLKQFQKSTIEALKQYGKIGYPHYYDLIDICRQVISNYFVDIVYSMNSAYKRRNIESFTNLGKYLLILLEDFDELLNSDVNYQLGQFTERAKLIGHGFQDRIKFYLYNAKLQVSTWAFFNNGILLDYSVKQWSGIVKDYNYPRWSLYIDYILQDLNNIKPYDHNKYCDDVWETIEEPFYKSPKSYPTTPVGDITMLVDNIINKYVNNNLNNYEIIKDVDYNGYDLDPDKKALWTRDIGQLANICDNDPECYGFLSNGYLKKKGGSTTPYTGINFYRKK